jgi:alpha-L-rhamnosidase
LHFKIFYFSVSLTNARGDSIIYMDKKGNSQDKASERNKNMTSNEMFGGAVWVAPAKSCTAPYMRKEFTAGGVKKAEITICGLGFFELFINGERVGDDLLVPANSQYEYRDLKKLGYPIMDTISYRIYCMKYDVTSYLKDEKNALGVILGNGWYNQCLNEDEGDVTYGRIKLCFRLDIEKSDGTRGQVLSGGDMLWAQSEITYNNIYKGERHDYALERDGFSKADFDASGFKPVELLPAPESNFCVQTCPADKVIRTIEPKLIKDLGDVSIYDAGEAITGYALVTSLSDGAEVTVRYADEILDDCTLTFRSTGRERKLQQEVFKNTAAGRGYFPRFCWHAFRYFEVSNNARPVEVRVIHADCPVTSDFESDNEILNWLYKTFLRTQLDNMHCGVPSDCPHIERLGYTGDGQLCAEAAMLMLDSREFYRKWLWDIADCQDVNNGHVQHTAPFMGGGGGPSGWGGAIVVVPYMFYRCYGEKEILEIFLPKMLKYFEYMQSRSESYLVWREEEGGWCLGDWCAPVRYEKPEPNFESRCLISETYVNTALLVRFMQMAVEISEIIGRPEMTAHLPELIEKYKRAITVAYYSPMTKDFNGNIQGANSYAIDIGLGGEETVRSTVMKYERMGRLDTGIFATDILPRVLFEHGNAQLAFELITSRSETSFWYMMTHGATTLWEDWQPERSLNHPMFGALTRYLFTYLLGIRQREGSAGFEKVLISPCLVNGLDRAKGHITTVNGKIGVSFVRTEKSVEFTVELDEGIDAVFELNGTEKALKAGVNVFKAEL